jgi:hypothetical protein
MIAVGVVVAEAATTTVNHPWVVAVVAAMAMLPLLARMDTAAAVAVAGLTRTVVTITVSLDNKHWLTPIRTETVLRCWDSFLAWRHATFNLCTSIHFFLRHGLIRLNIRFGDMVAKSSSIWFTAAQASMLLIVCHLVASTFQHGLRQSVVFL